MSPLVIAHRGASGYAPENTLSAFRLARKMGCQGLEFDVQLTKNGIPVVIHDETLDRTTNHSGQVSNLTWEEIKQVDAGGWRGKDWAGESIPSLEQVLREFSDLFLNIELKNSIVPYPGLEEAVLELVNQYCNPTQVLISSFHHPSIAKFKQLAAHIRTGLLYEQLPAENPMEIARYAKNFGADAVHPDHTLLTDGQVALFHQQGLLINTWTVNEFSKLEKMVATGVDGIITNYPDRLRTILAAK